MQLKTSVRPASHAGSWYEDDESSLKQEIETYLKNGKKYIKPVPSQFSSKKLKSIIVPHAGYYYCGETSGAVFNHVNPENYNRMVIIGPSHFQYFQGCALTNFSSFQTPFGNLDVDLNAINQIIKNDTDHLFSKARPMTEIKEHSLEMELPFIKYLYKNKGDNKNVSIVPIIVGETDLQENNKIARCLNDLYKDDNTLFVISSDFCHWGFDFDYTFYDKKQGEIWESVQYYDLMAVDIIKNVNSSQLDDYFNKTRNTICGRNPISIMLNLEEINGVDKNNSYFNCEKYTQSEKLMNKNQTSVSYAGCVLYA